MAACHAGWARCARSCSSCSRCSATTIDFPEEDDGPVPPERIGAQLERWPADSSGCSPRRPGASGCGEGALLVFAGRPNVGKSSLFNALLGTDRALVTEIPGTTRDTIEAHTEFLGWPVRLADTAGLWDAPERIDRLGIEVSRRYLAAADLVLLCVEAGGRRARTNARSRTERPRC